MQGQRKKKKVGTNSGGSSWDIMVKGRRAKGKGKLKRTIEGGFRGPTATEPKCEQQGDMSTATRSKYQES